MGRSSALLLCLLMIAAGSVLAQDAKGGSIVLEDFRSGEVGGMPEGWTWKKADNDKNKPYRIVEESDGNRYLEAEDTGESVILGKEIEWDLQKYPYIEFRWRARELPPGGDERYGDLNDSAAGIYITYRKKMGLIPVTVKYVWSSTLPVGSATQRSGTGRPWNVVADSGDENLGEWRTHVFDAAEAYRKTFGGKPPKRAIGIGVLSDANSVGGKAFADYDYIRALSKADAESGVVKKLEAE